MSSPTNSPAADPAIQATTPAFAEAMAAIHAAAFPPAEAWDARAFREQLSLPGVLGLAHAAGGLILLRVAADEAEILTLAVAPESRRRGVGHGLLQAAIGLLAEHGIRLLFLEVGVMNTAALALYASAGFEEVGRRRGYYADGSDARILRLSLGPTP
ncbi:MAG TPA: GNAT family N-acetyltransferase [Rhodopila sp.]|uniref:GNAT family N-acetyltransferase n=1 Tax=Rhodopila sp. TaxID=2480087 RepID=UPI002CC151B9|nr:GNAT family N-acetyltransferase [Rhodopila sp.]HVY17058.1 GNAT family N-acetyltransferase [Rhodopila sp.]